MIEVVKQYKKLKESIPTLIQVSGYRNDFIANKMGMTASYFSLKKQRGNWTDEEVEKLLIAVTSANKEVLNFLDIQHIEANKTGNTMTADEFENEMGWK